MLDQFQLAFADLVASPEFVSQVRGRPDLLHESYELTELEARRLVDVINQPGMECNCMLYRANRLVPVAMHLPELCKAVARDLRSLLSEFWALRTHTNANFLIESAQFCEFVRRKIEAGLLPDAVLPVLEREMATVSEQLDAIYPDGDDTHPLRNIKSGVVV